MERLTDKEININNYASFTECTICNNGQNISFSMAGGVSYHVPLEYFIRWFSDPHYLLVDDELIEWEKSERDLIKNELEFVACERILSNSAVRVYLCNGATYDVPWDTVLMACEEKYEHFGGLTSESKNIVNGWYQTKKGK